MSLSVRLTASAALEITDEHESLHGTLRTPVVVRSLAGPSVRTTYDRVEANAQGGLRGDAVVEIAGTTVTVVDEWYAVPGGVEIVRTISAPPGIDGDGLQFELEVTLPTAQRHRFLAPGIAYSPQQWARRGRYGYCDSRLAYPAVAAQAESRVTWLARLTPAAFDCPPQRVTGQTHFLQSTDLGSVGFQTGAVEALLASWPYAETDESAMLDAQHSPASAFTPVSEKIEARVSYRLASAATEGYADAVGKVFAALLEIADPKPSPLGVELDASIDLRLDSAAKTYFRSESGFAGFLLNFDPERGYDAEAKAFGASFAEHSMGGSHEILEYGFTGRQLNLAYVLARRDPEGWLDAGGAVVSSFVERMATSTGWVHTLWNAAEERPLFACGEPSGPVMHYLGTSALAGTYSRMMAEAGHDLLLNVALHESLGRDRPEWKATALSLADFFVKVQEDDGSWFRAYAPNGSPIVGSHWFGHRDGSGKTATAAVIPFLLDAAAHATHPEHYVRAAVRAGEFVLAHHVASAEYRGGTLDNPNLVDKEASFIAMRALLHLHEAQDAAGERDDRWLPGAEAAATVAVTWHSLTAVPGIAGTPLAEAGVLSTGWGGINSVWGVGVTDIYSLFFLADLVRLGRLTGQRAFIRVAELVAASSLQLLSTPGELHGFADTGMQPEGIAFCSQGVDDGLIVKGHTWGGLGWPYTAGTYGLGTYLTELRNTERVS